jgi:cholesterol transport system auxiliary component
MSEGQSMTRAGIKLGTALALVTSLSGCLNLGAGKVPDQLYTLSATDHAPVGAQFNARPADALVVEEPETDRSLASARMAVQVTPTSVAYLKDAWWVERPARLLRNLLAEDLRAGGKRLVQLDEDGGVGGIRLGGRLLAIGYDARSHAALIRYDATLSDGKGGVLMRRFEVSEPDVAANGGAVAAALNTAANTLGGQVAQWVNESRPAAAPTAP